MIFIGGGALLTRAVAHVVRSGHAVEVVCCPAGDVCLPRLRKLDVPIFESNQPNVDLVPILKKLRGKTAFSINNKFILSDILLDSRVAFFNIHNGLVQWYRGVSEVCIFAAICRGERQYGVTLHQLLPGQKVDSGPVVAQRTFDILSDDVFSSVLTKSLAACQAIFEENVETILDARYVVHAVELAGATYSYRDLARICSEADIAALGRARAIGPYAAFFPKLYPLDGMPESVRS